MVGQMKPLLVRPTLPRGPPLLEPEPEALLLLPLLLGVLEGFGVGVGDGAGTAKRVGSG